MCANNAIVTLKETHVFNTDNWQKIIREMFNINIQKNIVKGLGLQGLGIVQG
jgi:hypothetical protein